MRTNKYTEVDGIVYTPELIDEVINEMVHVRNEELKAGHMHWAVIFSHNIAILNDYKKRISE